MDINISNGFLLAVGILGIINFIIDYRKKTIKWWKYIFLIISILMIAEFLLSIFNPELLYKFFY